MPTSEVLDGIGKSIASPGGTVSPEELLAERVVRGVIAVLERASDSWRNGNPQSDGPLHWPVAVHFARAELLKALTALNDLDDRIVQLEAIAQLNADTVRCMQRARTER